MNIFNIPNVLTLIRIGFIPIILVLMGINNHASDLAAFVLYIIAAITDYFDGYFARSWNQGSTFGQALDPIADKLLISLCLFVLAGLDRIQGWDLMAACIILSREILVSGLREYLASLPVALPVSRAAKWKTVVQMIAVGALVSGKTFESGVDLHRAGVGLLWLAAAMTLVTGFDYLRKGLTHIQGR